MIKKFLKDKSFQFYATLITTILSLFIIIAFIISGIALYYNSEAGAHAWERSFSLVTISMVFLGIATQIVSLFKNYKFLPLIAVIFYSIAFAQHFYYASFAFANVLTGIDFFQDNLTFATIFFILLLIVVIGSITVAFIPQNKQNK